MGATTKYFLVPMFLILGISGGIAVGRLMESRESDSGTKLPSVPVSAAALQDTFAATADFAMKSVVHISATGSRYGHSADSVGSGVVLSKEGHILTNNHVVENSGALRVRFVDGREMAANILGTDPETDLAVIKIDVPEGVRIFPAVFGDSDRSRVGDWALAIGSPFGYNHTVTVGVVSAKHRQAQMDLAYQDFIQTDAAINPGNSGGALVNLKGELIGINTAIVSESRRNEGVGLAISSNLVKWVVERLRKEGRVQRGFLGLVPQSVNRDLVEALRSQEVRSMADFLKVTGLEKPEGAYIARVERGTPAWRAGLRAGDIILEFDGAKVRGSKDIFFKVAEVDPGTKVSVRVIRNREPLSFDVTLAERPGRDFNGQPRK